jgi:HSP20 family molecular chaperone IbpA
MATGEDPSRRTPKQENTMDANGPVTVRLADAGKLEARLEGARSEIRRRAYDLYCRRGERPGSALEDWAAAEREIAAVPLACVAEEDDKVRITACVAETEGCEVAVDVLPDEIVVEAERNGQTRRFTRIHLPARVDARAVIAQLHGTKLEVVARKAGVRLRRKVTQPNT